MSKNKTNKSVSKRVKVTARGKIKRYPTGSGHLKSRKTPQQLRRFRKAKGVSKGFAKHAKEMLGNS